MKRIQLAFAGAALAIILAVALVGPQTAQSQAESDGYTSVATERALADPGPEMNDNYLRRNPFYFEGRVDWELLNVEGEPSNAFEYMQRAIAHQDEEDYESAERDYRAALELNSLQNGTCQIVTAETLVGGVLPRDLTPAPCIFSLRARLAYLIHKDHPEEAIDIFNEVLEIDPMRLDINLLLGETWEVLGKDRDKAGDHDGAVAAYREAIAAFNAELALTPTPDSSISADEATDALVHWLLAHLHDELEEYPEALDNYEDYLKATKWHSDVLPWRIPLAEKKVVEIRQLLSTTASIRGTSRQAPARARGSN